MFLRVQAKILESLLVKWPVMVNLILLANVLHIDLGDSMMILLCILINFGLLYWYLKEIVSKILQHFALLRLCSSLRSCGLLLILFDSLSILGVLIVAKWHLELAIMWRIHCLLLRSFHLVVYCLQIITHWHQADLHMILESEYILGLCHFIDGIYLLYHAIYALDTLDVRLAELFFAATQILHIDILDAGRIFRAVCWRHLLWVLHADLNVLWLLSISHLVAKLRRLGHRIEDRVLFDVSWSCVLWIVCLCVQLRKRFLPEPWSPGHWVVRAAFATRSRTCCWPWWTKPPMCRRSLALLLTHRDWLWVEPRWGGVCRVLLLSIDQVFSLQVETARIFGLRIRGMLVRFYLLSSEIVVGWWTS